MSVKRLRGAFACIALFAWVQTAAAQDYPAKPVTIVCGQPAGTGPDVMARLFAEVMSRNMKQRVLVANRTGSGGIVAAASVAQAAPDGYTLLLVLNGTHTTVPAMQTMPFDPVKDFEFISLLYNSPSAMLVSAKNPAKTFADFVAQARATPDGLKYGSPALGSPAHITGALLGESAKINLTNVGYRGGGQIITDIIGGLLDATFTSSVQALPQIAQGNLRALAVTGTARLKQLPDVPTFAELGHGAATAESWFGIAAPKGTPLAVLDKLNAEVAKAAKDPMLTTRAEQDGITLIAGTREDFVRLLVSDYERLGKAVKRLNIKAE